MELNSAMRKPLFGRTIWLHYIVRFMAIDWAFKIINKILTMMEKITFQQKMNKDFEGSFEIRDLREKDRFVVDDKFLNGYARFLGVYAVGVYNSLCRHANKEQRCWPSIKKIAQELSIGRNKVFDSIKYLEFWQIIKKERLGKKLTNRYLLLSKRYWKPISESSLKDFGEVYHINFTSLLHQLP